MFSRRQFTMTALASTLAAPAVAAPKNYRIPSKFLPQEVDVNPELPAGQIQMLTIRRKVEWPSWTPTQNMIRLEPELYGPYRNGLPGGHPRNPMGARALYLYEGSRDTYYRIHGTPQPWAIGRSYSSGCVRLVNEHVEELYAQVPLETQVFIF